MVEKLANVYLFTGEEQLLIDQEIKKWKQGFASKNGENSVFVFDEENFDNNQAIQTSFWSGFFSSSSLTIIKGVPTSANTKSSKYQIFIDEFLKREGKIAEWSFLVFANSKPDKRAKLYKFLKTNAIIKEFPKLKKPQLKALINWNLARENITINNDTLEFFLAKTGDDLHTIINEIDKLVQRCNAQNEKTISNEMIEKIVYDYEKQDAFKFFGTLFKYGKEKTFKFIDKIAQEETNRNMFSWSVYWTLNLYLILLDFFEQGKESENEIKQAYKINPFVLKINLGQKENIKKNKIAIKKMYTGLVELDDAIKTGKKDQSEFWINLKKFINYFPIVFVAFLLSFLSFWSFSTTAHANFQDKLYCSLQQNTLTVKMNNTSDKWIYPCKNYVFYLKNKVLQEYKAITKINSLIKNSENKIFWLNIREKKEENIEKIIQLTTIIEKKTQKFEENLVNKVQYYLRKYFNKDQQKYQKISNNLERITQQETEQNIEIREKIITLKWKIYQANNKIETILNTKSMDKLLETLIQYIYLKKEIEWK